MAKKTAGSKSSSKKAASRSAKPAGKKTTAKKPTAKKSTTKKKVGKTSKASSSSKKSTKAKTTTKKTRSKTASKSASKSSVNTSSGTTAGSKKTPSAKGGSKKKAASAKGATPTASASDKRGAPEPKGSAKVKNASGSEARATDTKSAQAETADSKKSGRKGITIVENRPKRKTTGKPKITPPTGTLGALLAKRRRQPLIPSGPDAPPSPFGTFGQDGEEAGSKRKLKSPFKKRELDGFREKLLAKRRELVGDVANMESGMASRGDRGGNPALDVAEQGSDAYDQSLSIGFAEADRKIIREIDEALKRIDDGTYGLCEMTRQPIGVERLNQLPWARLSIEAAREIERRGGGR